MQDIHDAFSRLKAAPVGTSMAVPRVLRDG